MYSILRKVDNHIKNNNTAIKGVVFNSSYLPKYINKAILHEVRSFYDDFFDIFSSEITISYDTFGRIYLLVHDLRKRKNIFILEDKYQIDTPMNKDRVVFEKDLIRNAYMLRYVENYMRNVRNNININNPNASKKKKSIMEYEILKETIKKANKQLVDRNKDLFKIINYTDELHYSTMKIINYIDYLDNYYKKNILIKKR